MPSRSLEDHERVERGDAVVAADVRGGVVCAGGCNLERDCGVCGGDPVVAIEVACLRWRGNPWLHGQEAVDAGASVIVSAQVSTSASKRPTVIHILRIFYYIPDSEQIQPRLRLNCSLYGVEEEYILPHQKT